MGSIVTSSPALAAFAVALSISAPAAAQDARYVVDAKSMAGAFTRIGEPMVADTPNELGPVFRHDKGEYFLTLAHCAGGTGCKTIQLRACYEYPNANVAKANAWNRDKMFARAAMDANGRLCVDMVYLALDGKIDDVTLAGVLQMYREVRLAAPDAFNKP